MNQQYIIPPTNVILSNISMTCSVTQLRIIFTQLSKISTQLTKWY